MSESLANQRSMIDLDEFERRLHRPSTPSGGGEDPLAELARLVSGSDDPYSRVFDAPLERGYGQSTPQTSWDQQPYTPPKNHPLAGDFAAIQAGLLRGALDEPGEWSAPAPAAPPYSEEGYGHEPADGEWAPAYATPPRSRKPLYLTAGIIVLGLAGIGASFALKGHVGGPREIATIAAASGPTKIQPETPDGVDVPNQDASILDKSPRPNAVALSNDQEQPIDLSQLPSKAPNVLSVGNAPLTGAALSDQQVATAAVKPTPAQQPMGIAALIEPRKVRTVSVRPDGTVLPNDQPPPQPSAQTTAAAPRASGAANGTATPVAKPSTPKSTTRVVTTPKPAPAAVADAGAPMQIAAAKPKPAAAPPKPAQVATAGAGRRRRRGARRAGGRRRRRLRRPARGARLGARRQGRGVEARRQIRGRTWKPASDDPQGDGRDKGRVRVRVVNLSREDATALCQKLQAGGGTCFVAKN